jgi:hypothetical protein
MKGYRARLEFVNERFFHLEKCGSRGFWNIRNLANWGQNMVELVASDGTGVQLDHCSWNYLT